MGDPYDGELLVALVQLGDDFRKQRPGDCAALAALLDRVDDEEIAGLTRRLCDRVLYDRPAPPTRPPWRMPTAAPPQDD